MDLQAERRKLSIGQVIKISSWENGSPDGSIYYNMVTYGFCVMPIEEIHESTVVVYSEFTKHHIAIQDVVLFKPTI